VSGTRSVAARAKGFSAGKAPAAAKKTGHKKTRAALPFKEIEKWPAPASIAIVVEEPMWHAHQGVIGTIRRAARTAAAAGPVTRQSGFDKPELCILLADDEYVRGLNSRYRHRHKPTNVLSFPAAPVFAPRLGDIVLSYGVLCREAEAQGKTLAAHAAHLTIHGVLHLFGYDHQNRREAAAMEKLETSLLSGMGYADPYGAVPVRRRSKRPKLEHDRE